MNADQWNRKREQYRVDRLHIQSRKQNRNMNTPIKKRFVVLSRRRFCLSMGLMISPPGGALFIPIRFHRGVLLMCSLGVVSSIDFNGVHDIYHPGLIFMFFGTQGVIAFSLACYYVWSVFLFPRSVFSLLCL